MIRLDEKGDTARAEIDPRDDRLTLRVPSQFRVRVNRVGEMIMPVNKMMMPARESLLTLRLRLAQMKRRLREVKAGEEAFVKRIDRFDAKELAIAIAHYHRSIELQEQRIRLFESELKNEHGQLDAQQE